MHWAACPGTRCPGGAAFEAPDAPTAGSGLALLVRVSNRVSNWVSSRVSNRVRAWVSVREWGGGGGQH